jgi:transposase
MLYIGIDVGKFKHHAVALDDRGQQRFSLELNNRHDGIEKLLNAIGQESSLIALEATGHYWLAFWSHLAEAGKQIRVVNPLQAQAAKGLMLRKLKTDATDAHLLAQCLRLEIIDGGQVPDEHMWRLRELCRLRFAIVMQVAEAKMRVLRVLDKVFPEYAGTFSDTFIQASRALLQAHATAEEIAQADLSELARLLKENSHGRLGLAAARKVQDKARSSFGITFAADALGLELRLLLEQVDFLLGQVDRIEEEINATIEKTPLPFAGQIKGVGGILAVTVFAEAGDITRFSSAKKFVAFCGLDASVFRSGQFEARQAHISKRGSPPLRWALYLLAHSCVLHNPTFKTFYDRLRKNGKPHKVAMVATARKLATVIYSVWKQSLIHPRTQSFDPSGA